MKRSPLNRKTPLRRGDSQLKRTPMKRGRSKRKQQYDAEFAEIRPLVLRRDRVCRGRNNLPGDCGGNPHVHHVLPRSRGGQNTMQNLVLLCGVHHEWVHQHPDLARKEGLYR